MASHSNKPRNENDPLSSLEEERARIQKRYDTAEKKRRAVGADVGFFTLLGGGALLLDWTVFGGVGTALAVLSGGSWIMHKEAEHKIGKELKAIDDRIIKLKEEQARADISRRQFEAAQPRPQKDLSGDFSPAAQREIAMLRRQLEELNRKMDELGGDKQIDKPKYKPPSS